MSDPSAPLLPPLCAECDQAECVCPPAVTLCWHCEGVIPAGQGRNKNGWLVHELCPVPSEAGR